MYGHSENLFVFLIEFFQVKLKQFKENVTFFTKKPLTHYESNS